MENKIREYVNYQFRFREPSEVEDLKEEVILNLIDRYQENLKIYNDEDKAYIEAIKQMGDFAKEDKNQIPEEFTIKPSFPDILLVCGMILSIFGLMLTLINTIAGTIITSISIITYASACYYLYSYSQFVRKNYMDIEKHNILLKKIFKYLKNNIIFWSISLSLVIAAIVSNLITGIFGYAIINTNNIDQNSVKFIIFVSVIVFLLSLIILLYVFHKLYNKALMRYYLLTGEKNLKGSFRDIKKFLDVEKSNRPQLYSRFIKSYKIIPIISLITIVVSLLVKLDYEYIYTIGDTKEVFFDRPILQYIITFFFNDFFSGLFVSLNLLVFLTFIVLSLIKKNNYELHLIILNGLWIVSSIVINFTASKYSYFDDYTGIVVTLCGNVIILIYLLLRYIYKKIKA